MNEVTNVQLGQNPIIAEIRKERELRVEDLIRIEPQEYAFDLQQIIKTKEVET